VPRALRRLLHTIPWCGDRGSSASQRSSCARICVVPWVPVLYPNDGGRAQRQSAQHSLGLGARRRALVGGRRRLWPRVEIVPGLLKGQQARGEQARGGGRVGGRGAGGGVWVVDGRGQQRGRKRGNLGWGRHGQRGAVGRRARPGTAGARGGGAVRGVWVVGVGVGGACGRAWTSSGSMGRVGGQGPGGAKARLARLRRAAARRRLRPAVYVGGAFAEEGNAICGAVGGAGAASGVWRRCGPRGAGGRRCVGLRVVVSERGGGGGRDGDDRRRRDGGGARRGAAVQRAGGVVLLLLLLLLRLWCGGRAVYIHGSGRGGGRAGEGGQSCLRAQPTSMQRGCRHAAAGAGTRWTGGDEAGVQAGGFAGAGVGVGEGLRECVGGTRASSCRCSGCGAMLRASALIARPPWPKDP
jgi:hypothetical protein